MSTRKLLLVLLVASLLQVHGTQGCVPLDDPCSAFYPCCSCDPKTNLKLRCDLISFSKGLRCTTYAFEPRCSRVSMEDEFDLPRKLGFSNAETAEMVEKVLEAEKVLESVVSAEKV